MNVVFTVILIISLSVLTFTSPSMVMEAFSVSANKSITLSVTLLAVYVVWLGVSELLNSSGISEKIAKALKPLISFLFKTKNPKTINEISINLSANLLGLGGIATPSGINAMGFLDEEKNEHGKTMLFVITATSIQIFPLSVMALMTEYGSTAPHEVFLPTLITTAVSTGVGILLTFTFK